MILHAFASYFLLQRFFSELLLVLKMFLLAERGCHSRFAKITKGDVNCYI